MSHLPRITHLSTEVKNEINSYTRPQRTRPHSSHHHFQILQQISHLNFNHNNATILIALSYLPPKKLMETGKNKKSDMKYTTQPRYICKSRKYYQDYKHVSEQN